MSCKVLEALEHPGGRGEGGVAGCHVAVVGCGEG